MNITAPVHRLTSSTASSIGCFSLPSRTHFLRSTTFWCDRPRSSSCSIAPFRPFSSNAADETARLLEVAKAKSQAYHDASMASTGLTATVEDQIRLSRIMKDLAPISGKWAQYQDLQAQIREVARHMEEPDEDIQQMFTLEHDELVSQLDHMLRHDLPAALLPPPVTSYLPAIVSINAGVGGAEASLCVADLSRMYTRYAERQNWKMEIVSQTEGPSDRGDKGIKEITFKIQGSQDQEVYGMLQWEKGVHRIQRVPVTDMSGRIHTSTITVVVLPIYPDAPDALLVDPKDVKTEVMRSRGAGGQHVNKTESAVRLTHVPSGISVSMQDSRSQHQNRAWAWEILRARLSERKHAEEVEAKRASRRNQVKGADRSDKIRTYNFQQDRVTDHRINQSFSDLEGILDGEGLDNIIEALRHDFKQRRLTNLLEDEEDIDE